MGRNNNGGRGNGGRTAGGRGGGGGRSSTNSHKGRGDDKKKASAAKKNATYRSNTDTKIRHDKDRLPIADKVDGVNFATEEKEGREHHTQLIHTRQDSDLGTKQREVAPPVVVDHRIPFNKPPFFKNSFMVAMESAFQDEKFSGDGINCQKCTEFLKTRYGYGHTLLTPSCTAALEMAALLLNLGVGDEVIVPSFTFVTTANAFALRGVTLVFADSEQDHPNVSIADILTKVTQNTKAIVVVHYAGVPVDVQRLLKETKHEIPVIEDCAHAIESIDPKTGDYVGKAGCLATFSFHETKNIGIGEGGLLVVNNRNLWKRAQIIREKGTNRTDFIAGKVDSYTWIDLGSSYLMSDVNAALLWSVLQHIDSIQHSRMCCWDRYDNELPKSWVYKKPRREFQRANAHMYFLEFQNTEVRSEFCTYMSENNILVSTHYVPLDTSPFVLEQVRNSNQLSVGPCYRAEAWSKRLVRLPLFADLSTEELGAVISTISKFILMKQATSLRLVPATEECWEAIRKIRNDNRNCFTHKKIIPKDEHWKFMHKHWRTYRVCLQANNDGEESVVGFIGHVNRDVRLATNAKGKGVGQFMWKSFVKEVGGLDVKVLGNNQRCLSFARKFGYHPDEKPSADGENPVRLTKGFTLQSKL